jgi:glycosyltransferase involved in cell wall biosynthesis
MKNCQRCWLACICLSLLLIATLAMSWTRNRRRRVPKYQMAKRYDFEPEGIIAFERVPFARRSRLLDSDSNSASHDSKDAQDSNNQIEWQKKRRRKLRKLITLCTQLSTDRLVKLNDLVLTWQGPVSAALYVRNESDALAALEHYDRSPELVEFVDLHLLYANNTRYPANVLRNVALEWAQSDAVLCLDADFVCRVRMHQRLQHALGPWLAQKDRERKARESAPAAKSGWDWGFGAASDGDGVGGATDRRVFVVPSFESDLGADRLQFDGKRALLDAMRREEVAESNMDVCWRCHTPTKYKRWYNAHSMYEARYRWIYEPYIVFSKADADMPRFHERLMGYGFDKNTHAFHLAVAGYTFHVLHDAFAVHVNHKEANWDGPDIQSQLWDALAIVCDLLPSLKERYGYNPSKRLFDEPLPRECYSNHHF